VAQLVREMSGAVFLRFFAFWAVCVWLRGARERNKRATGKCDGRKGHAELRPDVVALARELRRRKPKPCARPFWLALARRSSRQSWRGCCATNRERCGHGRDGSLARAAPSTF
jgi:hypothetical protein